MPNADRAALSRLGVLATLAKFPEGTSIAQLTRQLADGVSNYDTLYRRIYGALRSLEASGHARRAGYRRYAVLFRDTPGVPTFGGHRPAVLWQITSDGAAYVATCQTQTATGRPRAGG